MVVDNLVITTEVSLDCQLQGKSLLVRCSIVFSDILRTTQLSQKANVEFALVVDMSFAARQVQEKYQKQNNNLLLIFVDLSKASDTVCRVGRWAIMKTFRCLERFILIIRQLHDGMKVGIVHNGDISEVIPVSNGLKQGCISAPTLFSMMLSATLIDALEESKEV